MAIDMGLSAPRHFQISRSVVAVVLVVFPWFIAQPAHAADEVVTDCRSDGQLRAKLAALQNGSGGILTFNCSSTPVTITLTSVLPPITTNTTIDGGNGIALSGNNTTRVFEVSSAGTLTLRNITVTNGWADGDGGAITNHGTLVMERSTIRHSATTERGNGGAIVSYGPLTLIDSTLADNSAKNAGAIFMVSPSARLRMMNTTLHDNEARGPASGQGGAILLEGGATVEMAGGVIVNNTGSVGGGIFSSHPDSNVTLTNVTLMRNTALYGGGIFTEYGTATLTNVTLNENIATYGSGGGIVHYGSTLTLTNVSLTRNIAGSGGGISNKSNGPVTLTNVSFTGNEAGSGGGLSNTGIATLINVTLAGNTASRGGGIENIGSATLINVTLADNHGPQGSGIYNFTPAYNNSLNLKNVVLADNNGGGNCAGDAPRSATFSLSSDTTCALNGTGNRTNTSAYLPRPTNYGAGTTALIPLESSPLIDGGECVPGVSTDQRGVLRPQRATCDIGAVEVREREPRVYLPLIFQ